MDQKEITDEELIAAIEADVPTEDDTAPVELEESVQDEAEQASDQVSQEETPDDDVQSSEEGVQDQGETDEGEQDSPEPEPEPAAEAEPEPEPKPEPEEAKPSDEFGTLEDSVPEKTRERFEAIKTKYDAIVAERDAIRQESDGWVQAITGTGTNPTQFNMALEWLSSLNSGTAEGLEKAYSIMERELQAVGKMLGKSTPGVYNPLDEYPDLKTKVSDGMLDEADAMEIVKARAALKLHESREQQMSEKSQSEKRVQDAYEKVAQYGKALQKSDPYFHQKAPYLKAFIGSLPGSGTPPEKWLEVITTAYTGIPNPQVNPPPRSNAPNPIRPTGTTPATTPLDKEPGSAMEALEQALARGY